MSCWAASVFAAKSTVSAANGYRSRPASRMPRQIGTHATMAHAIAPGAKIILVTSADNSNPGLINAVNYAAQLPGVTGVSLSYSLGGTADVFAAEDGMLAQLQAIEPATNQAHGPARLPMTVANRSAAAHTEGRNGPLPSGDGR
jgi:hypothetical protein